MPRDVQLTAEGDKNDGEDEGPEIPWDAASSCGGSADGSDRECGARHAVLYRVNRGERPLEQVCFGYLNKSQIRNKVEFMCKKSFWDVARATSKLGWIGFAASFGVAAHAQTGFLPTPVVDLTRFDPGSYSSSISYSSSVRTPSAAEEEKESLPDAPDAPAALSRVRERRVDIPAPGIRETRPFRSLAVGVTLGSSGIGLQLATPINSKFNLRTDASFFSYDTSFTADTIPIVGHLHLASVSTSLDWAPTAHNFHISPGVTFYDNTNFNATIYIPGNQVVMLDGVPYTSDPADPIRGTAHLTFGQRIAPRLTMGYGNVIRHHTAGFTFPVEVGFEYIRTPVAAFQLTGSSCDAPNDCGPINADPETQQNIQEQQQEINDDIRLLRFFPIFSFGVSYKFGH